MDAFHSNFIPDLSRKCREHPNFVKIGQKCGAWRQFRHRKHFTHLSILYIMLLNNTHRTHCCGGNVTMIKRMRHNLMFYVHCLSCFITHGFKRQIRYKRENQTKRRTEHKGGQDVTGSEVEKVEAALLPKTYTYASKRLNIPKDLNSRSRTIFYR